MFVDSFGMFLKFKLESLFEIISVNLNLSKSASSIGNSLTEASSKTIELDFKVVWSFLGISILKDLISLLNFSKLEKLKPPSTLFKV